MKNVFTKYMRTKSEDKAHSLYSASSMERTLGCPGSISLIKKAPKAKDNVHSVRGTNTHTLIEFIIKEGEHHLYTSDAKEFKEFIQYDDQMHISAKVAVLFLKEEYARWVDRVGHKPKVLIEQKLPLNDLLKEDCGGTADMIMYQYFGDLHVIDYKNGKSIVEPRQNKQGMTYALGALEKFGWDFKSVTITIIQPNARHEVGPIRSWVIGLDRMEAFKEELIRGIALTKKKDAPLNEDPKWCWFCPAKDICPVQMDKKRNKVLTKFQKVFD